MKRYQLTWEIQRTGDVNDEAFQWACHFKKAGVDEFSTVHDMFKPLRFRKRDRAVKRAQTIITALSRVGGKKQEAQWYLKPVVADLKEARKNAKRLERLMNP